MLTPAMLAVGVGLLAFAARYAVTGAIENDHFVTFTRALQVVHGDWPVRDFDDPGFPLSYLLSSLVAMIVGPSLFVNVLLCVALLAITSAVTFLLAFRATDSVATAIAAAAATMIMYPRLYNAPKVIVPVIAVWLAWRYADRRDPGRLVALAAWSAAAFLFRHDYVVYVAAGSVMALVISHAAEPRVMVTRLVAYGALSLLFVAPWLIYVQALEWLQEYFASALRFVDAERHRTTAGLPPMFYIMLVIPVAGLLACAKADTRLGRAHLAAASTILLTLDVVFLRDVLQARIPDVIAPTAIVAAAVVARFLPRRVMRLVTAVVAAGLAFGVLVYVARRWEVVATPVQAADHVAQVTRRLRAVSPEIIPNQSLAPLIAFLGTCTRADARVLVAGFGPEIPALAHRSFAARLPSWLPGYDEDAADVGRAVAQLHRERLGAAVFLDGTNVVSRSWPPLMQDIRERGLDEYAVPAIDQRVRVWLPHDSAGAMRDPATGLPCPTR
jgi:hypothetical protein